jgi:hypothetical protein
MSTNKVSSEARQVELSIDSYCESTPLTKSPLSTAAAHLLMSLEASLTLSAQTPSLQRFSAKSDHLISGAGHATRWVHKKCRRSNRAPNHFSDLATGNAYNAIALGINYDPFYYAYTLASRGIITLTTEREEIITQGLLTESPEYEAYNRLTKPSDADQPTDEIIGIANNIRSISRAGSINILSDSYTSVLHEIEQAISSSIALRFSLPEQWETSKYTFGEFKSTFIALCSLCVLKILINAVHGKGIESFIIATDIKSIAKRIAQIANTDSDKSHGVLSDLTYGSNSIVRPDIAIQPLIPVNNDTIILAPHLPICISPERNLCVLLNKIDFEKKNYLALVSQKEEIMAEKIKNGITRVGIKFAKRIQLKRLSDIDLAIIEESTRSCLIVELKWFIYPAEPQEVLHKSEELKEGVKQAQKIINGDRNLILNALGIDRSYSIDAAVASENWIGMSNVQNPTIPIINAQHLTDVVNNRGLRATIEWLKGGRYLPQQDIDFRVINWQPKIGRWKLRWYGIQPLHDRRFWPL